MSSEQKLTKKQKKALAFRERKGKSKASPEDAIDQDEDAGDIPVDENQDRAEMEVAQMEVEKVSGKSKKQLQQEPKSKKKASGEEEGAAKKRKRDATDDQEPPPQKKKKKAAKTSGEDGEDAEASESAAKPKAPQRYILFIGNLRYGTSKETITKHFESCDPPPTVRLPTPKTTEPINKSKGYAFLEFTEKSGLQTALKLHHSDLEGRKINVELTAGGGGKSENRLNKVKERNKGLHEQRKRKIEKLKKPAGGGGDQDQLTELERPQRYSTTSGIGQAPSNKRTWSIPGTEEEAQGSGKKRGKKRPVRPPKEHGTGVNAIPVY